ncbi:MAG: hypothetical protein K0S65_2344 [Labilithrix sp.]|nr:hypothetical protein [Labilithrix sp.]
MTTPRRLLLSSSMLAAGALLLAACDEDPNALLGRRKNAPGANGELSPEALQCTEKPAGRSYALFDGTKLEDVRVNENAGINRARFKPYAVLAGEYQRVLGVVPKSLAGAGASFDDPPARWFAESAHSSTSLNAAFAISFEACGAFVATGADYAAAPTDDSADGFCRTTMRKAWSRSPSPEEVGGCVELATKKLGDEPDARRRWSYVCASILSSSNFLTF